MPDSCRYGRQELQHVDVGQRGDDKLTLEELLHLSATRACNFAVLRRRHISCGIIPDKIFPSIRKSSSLNNIPISDGIVPVKKEHYQKTILYATTKARSHLTYQKVDSHTNVTNVNS